MPISANIWIFPAVKKARMMKVKKRNENAPSTMRRNVGCKEEPGLRIFAIKESSDGEPSVISVVGAMGKSKLPMRWPQKRQLWTSVGVFFQADTPAYLTTPFQETSLYTRKHSTPSLGVSPLRAIVFHPVPLNKIASTEYTMMKT